MYPKNAFRTINPEFINKEKPWAYFDGAAQYNPLIGGVGGVIFFSENHTLSFKSSVGQGTNNLAEIKALRFLLVLAIEKNLKGLQFFWQRPEYNRLGPGEKTVP